LSRLWLFLSGCLLGVCITVGMFYIRGPVYQRLLSRRAAALREDIKAVVPLRPDESSLGAVTAPATMIEYSDFQCPFCAMFRTETFPSIKARYIDSGKLRFIHRHFPLPNHTHAMTAAQVAACAGEQGAYWRVSEALFSRANCLGCQGPLELLNAVSMNRRELEECLSSKRFQTKIDEDIASAKRLNFHGTPAFVIGRSTSAGVEGVSFSGALAFEAFAAKIEQILK
jgi:protein-disulfide isomerase